MNIANDIEPNLQSEIISRFAESRVALVGEQSACAIAGRSSGVPLLQMTSAKLGAE